MQVTALLNKNGNDSIQARQIWGGNPTGLVNINNTKYNWAVKLYKQMLENFWIPNKVDLSADVVNYNEMLENERKAYDGILGYLTFLDSIQTCNLDNIRRYVTAPEISMCIGKQVDQEQIHNLSYQTILEAIIPYKEERNLIYDYWRDDKVLYERCCFLTKPYEEAANNPGDEDKYFLSLFADYLLESMYFYMGFNFFHLLSSRQLMNGSNDMITYIKKDEYTHVLLFQRLLEEAMKIFPHSKEQMYEMVSEAIQQETQWMDHITEDKVLGLSSQKTEDYLKWLGNTRLRAIGLEAIFDAPKKSPYAHLDKIGDQSNEANLKANFFESTVTAYNISSSLQGWDSF